MGLSALWTNLRDILLTSVRLCLAIARVLMDWAPLFPEQKKQKKDVVKPDRIALLWSSFSVFVSLSVCL